MTEAAGRLPALRVADLIVAEGPEGAERILIAGLTVSVAAGEIVAVLADDAASAAALVQVLDGRRRAQYGTLAAGGGGRTRRVAPARPAGVRVVRPGQPTSTGTGAPTAVVVDATGTGRGPACADTARTAARAGSGVLIVTT
ncbi:hypothetical protein ABT160_45365, partial [Streptomyces sp. NPDC001941]